ncbi:MAG TPA: hypothetical protein VH538_08650 [Gaiellaceae bacterium]
MTARLPRASTLVAPLLAATILAGCGGSGGGKPAQRVTGPGFSFAAPGGWQVARSGNRVSAGSGSDLVQVATFRLLRPYSAPLFAKVAKELDVRMAGVAKQTSGTLAGSSVVKAGGVRSHSYRVATDDRVDEYTFVLQGMHEYQLLCRRSASHDDKNCRLLLSSFKIGKGT